MSHEIETVTIRIPIRLQRRGGRQLIVTPEGTAAPAQKPSRDETLVKAPILDPRQPKRLRLAEVLGNGPVGWEEQRRAWGFA